HPRLASPLSSPAPADTQRETSYRWRPAYWPRTPPTNVVRPLACSAIADRAALRSLEQLRAHDEDRESARPTCHCARCAQKVPNILPSRRWRVARTRSAREAPHAAEMHL